MDVKPCPFCGSTSIRIGQIDRGVGGMGAREPSVACVCPGCLAGGPLAGYADDYREFCRQTGAYDDKAYEAWLVSLAWERWNAPRAI